jgi:hypothetical protein
MKLINCDDYKKGRRNEIQRFAELRECEKLKKVRELDTYYFKKLRKEDKCYDYIWGRKEIKTPECIRKSEEIPSTL